MTEQGGYDYSMKSDKYKNRKHTSWKTFREIIGSYLAVVFCMEEKIGSNRQHKLILQNRGKGNITGICDVVSFDENAVVLDTDMGLLTIKGKELHVSRLTLEKGEVDIEGTIDSMVYSSNEALRKSGESLFTRLFK